MNRQKAIIQASWVGIGVNLLLALLKIGGGYFFDSLAVMGDGIDSANDVATYFITLVAARIMMRPPDERFPYGYNRAEAIATKLLSFFIFFIGAQLVFTSSAKLISGEVSTIPATWALWITAISVVVKLALSWWQMKRGKQLESKMLIANAVNMRNDILLSLSVLFGVAASLFWGLSWIDPILALFVGLWILKVAFDLFRETSTELMDSLDNTEVYKKIFESVDAIEGASNPHRIRVRHLSNLIIIEMDIEVDGDLPLKDAHEIGVQVENEIHNRIERVYDIMIHFEPLGNYEEKEKFGIGKQS
ncbi:cation transporter [bacterium SCSIO 12741]|nr:cation transporter [bacterium SCSIO 12741]